MWPPWPHIAVMFYYTYKLSYLFSWSRWCHIFYGFYILFMGLIPLRVTQKPKYSISVCPEKYFSMLHLSPFSFSLLSVNYSFCAWSVKSSLVKINKSSMYARINLNPWNKSFIFCWKFSGEFADLVGRHL